MYKLRHRYIFSMIIQFIILWLITWYYFLHNSSTNMNVANYIWQLHSFTYDMHMFLIRKRMESWANIITISSSFLHFIFKGKLHVIQLCKGEYLGFYLSYENQPRHFPSTNVRSHKRKLLVLVKPYFWFILDDMSWQWFSVEVFQGISIPQSKIDHFCYQKE